MDTLDLPADGIAFGRHLFDPARCELRTAGGPPVSLGQRAGRLLHALLEAGGRVLSRDDLVRSAWPGQDVDDGNLRVQIAALRRALADDRELIGTVAGRGYLFAGQAERRASPRARLPRQAGPCIGRAALVDDVLARCASQRFVTLAGPAGIGKTTLALAIAHRLRYGAEPGAAQGPGRGVAWVELDGVAHEQGVLAAVGAALGWRVDDAAALAARLRDVALLLVLDDCDHVAEPCSRLAETLRRLCPRLTLLATSRQPLLAHGETVVRVPGLALPAPGDTAPASLRASGAVELFLLRAGAGPADAAQAAAICRRLDGLPLAIELAAAQAATLGVPAVAAALDGQLDLLLGAGRQAALPRATARHRTLRAALDWSYVLLPEVAQRALRAVARFPAWFTLDDAAALLAPALSPYDTIDGLASLAAHSLLVVDQHARPARYRLLATTRAYALSKS